MKRLLSRINRWFVSKIRHWIGIEVYFKYVNETVTNLIKKIDTIDNLIEKIDTINNHYDTNIDQINKDLNLLKSLCEVGVDVHTRSNSWAVVCMGGKPEYVKFVDLKINDAHSVIEFLRKFESSGVVIDSPLGFVNTLEW